MNNGKITLEWAIDEIFSVLILQCVWRQINKKRLQRLKAQLGF